MLCALQCLSCFCWRCVSGGGGGLREREGQCFCRVSVVVQMILILLVLPEVFLVCFFPVNESVVADAPPACLCRWLFFVTVAQAVGD